VKQPVALVTGGSSGIGQGIARLLARNNFTVFAASRNPGSADEIAGAELLPLDVTADDSASACIDAVLARAGRLDALVNNAGYILQGAVEETSMEEARLQFETNLFGVMRMVRLALPSMRRQRSGAIVNISSLAGLVPGPPFCGVYSASKHALEAYTAHLRREVRPFNIRVALVEPGSIRTRLTANRVDAAQRLPEYDAWRRAALGALAELEAKGPEPDRVAPTVLAILTNPTPRLRNRVGRDAALVSRLHTLLPEPLFERSLKKIFHIENMP
jgi:NAD(P)-dependent dehydrogenase (short-subunit alcohol dehydrogenase family)